MSLESQLISFDIFFHRIESRISLLLGKRDPISREDALAKSIGEKSLRNLFQEFLIYGYNLVFDLLSEKEIPKDKKIQSAMEALASRAKAPNKPLAFWVKYETGFRKLLESKNWPEKKDHLKEVGSFQFHDTLGIDSSKLHGLFSHVEKAEALVKKRILQGNKILYGKITLVDKISRPNWGAWYFSDSDEIYIKPLANGFDQSFIHELGHRYWKKLLNSNQKASWKSTFQRIKDKYEEPTIEEVEKEFLSLKVGDVFPMKVSGLGRSAPKIIALEPHRKSDVLYTLLGTKQIQVLRSEALRVRKNTLVEMKEIARFPTQYASSDFEEYFCECFSLYALGKLQDPHEEEFESLLFGY